MSQQVLELCMSPHNVTAGTVFSRGTMYRLWPWHMMNYITMDARNRESSATLRVGLVQKATASDLVQDLFFILGEQA